MSLSEDNPFEPNPSWHAKTMERLSRPQVGDCFMEMYAFWCYVVKITDEFVFTVETPGGKCTLPDDGLLKKYSIKDGDMVKRFTFDSSRPWVEFIRSEPEEVNDWYDFLVDKHVPLALK